MNLKNLQKDLKRIWRRRRRYAKRVRMLRNLKNGKIHLIGSDCHDLISRPPNLGPVRRLMRVYRTEAEFSILEQNAAGLLFPGGTL